MVSRSGVLFPVGVSVRCTGHSSPLTEVLPSRVPVNGGDGPSRARRAPPGGCSADTNIGGYNQMLSPRK